MTIVVDANIALAAATSPGGFKKFEDRDLIAPPLLWPESRSALHVAVWRGLVPRELADRALEALESGAIKERRPRGLGDEVWAIADEMRWSKTYDAEYLALARLAGAGLATLDLRLNRAAERLDVPLADLR